jgi:hypothetical protein
MTAVHGSGYGGNMEELVATIVLKGWPWKRPQAGTLTHHYGGTWTHMCSRWNWWTFHWETTFERRFPQGNKKP